MAVPGIRNLFNCLLHPRAQLLLVLSLMGLYTHPVLPQ